MYLAIGHQPLFFVIVATLAVKACLRAAAMFSISNEDTRQTKSSRAGLLLHVGKMHRYLLFNVFGANYLLSVFWTLNFVKKYWISMKILSPKILDFYENTWQNTGLLWKYLSKYWTSWKYLSKYWTSTKSSILGLRIFIEIQYFFAKF